MVIRVSCLGDLHAGVFGDNGYRVCQLLSGDSEKEQ